MGRKGSCLLPGGTSETANGRRELRRLHWASDDRIVNDHVTVLEARLRVNSVERRLTLAALGSPPPCARDAAKRPIRR